jgi:hypothetical protein
MLFFIANKQLKKVSNPIMTMTRYNLKLCVISFYISYQKLTLTYTNNTMIYFVKYLHIIKSTKVLKKKLAEPFFRLLYNNRLPSITIIDKNRFFTLYYAVCFSPLSVFLTRNRRLVVLITSITVDTCSGSKCRRPRFI